MIIPDADRGQTAAIFADLGLPEEQNDRVYAAANAMGAAITQVMFANVDGAKDRALGVLREAKL